MLHDHCFSLSLSLYIYIYVCISIFTYMLVHFILLEASFMLRSRPSTLAVATKRVQAPKCDGTGTGVVFENFYTPVFGYLDPMRKFGLRSVNACLEGTLAVPEAPNAKPNLGLQQLPPNYPTIP